MGVLIDGNSATFHVSGGPGDDKISERHTVAQQELAFGQLIVQQLGQGPKTLLGIGNPRRIGVPIPSMGLRTFS